MSNKDDINAWLPPIPAQPFPPSTTDGLEIHKSYGNQQQLEEDLYVIPDGGADSSVSSSSPQPNNEEIVAFDEGRTYACSYIHVVQSVNWVLIP